MQLPPTLGGAKARGRCKALAPRLGGANAVGGVLGAVAWQGRSVGLGKKLHAQKKLTA